MQHPDSWDGAPEQAKDVLRGMARAAIAAMREPTEEMKQAGFWDGNATLSTYRAMIERVAKAINDAMLQHGDYKPDELARAAIEAMREPSEEMVFAGDAFEPDGISAEAIWIAMIDAALECSTKQTEK
jgi:hypothetical protein